MLLIVLGFTCLVLGVVLGLLGLILLTRSSRLTTLVHSCGGVLATLGALLVSVTSKEIFMAVGFALVIGGTVVVVNTKYGKPRFSLIVMLCNLSIFFGAAIITVTFLS